MNRVETWVTVEARGRQEALERLELFYRKYCYNILAGELEEDADGGLWKDVCYIIDVEDYENALHEFPWIVELTKVE